MLVDYLCAVMNLQWAFVSTGRRDNSPRVFAAPTTSAFNLFDCIFYEPAYEMRVNNLLAVLLCQKINMNVFYELFITN